MSPPVLGQRGIRDILNERVDAWLDGRMIVPDHFKPRMSHSQRTGMPQAWLVFRFPQSWASLESEFVVIHYWRSPRRPDVHSQHVKPRVPAPALPSEQAEGTLGSSSDSPKHIDPETTKGGEKGGRRPEPGTCQVHHSRNLPSLLKHMICSVHVSHSSTKMQSLVLPR